MMSTSKIIPDHCNTMQLYNKHKNHPNSSIMCIKNMELGELMYKHETFHNNRPSYEYKYQTWSHSKKHNILAVAAILDPPLPGI